MPIDKTISQLTEATVAAPDDILPFVQQSPTPTTKKITVDNLGDSLHVTTTVNANSANWSSVYTSVAPVSTNWNSAYTSVNATSGVSPLVTPVYTTVNSNSAFWSSTYSSVNTTSATWTGGNNAYTNLNTNSAFYGFIAATIYS